MAAIVTLVVLVALAVVVVLFVRDAKRAQQRHAGLDGPDDTATPATPPAQPTRPPVAPPSDTPPPPEPTYREPIDADELAEHIRELRRALERELLEEDEAVASIMRQSGGNVGEEGARQLLHSGDEPASAADAEALGGEATDEAHDTGDDDEQR